MDADPRLDALRRLINRQQRELDDLRHQFVRLSMSDAQAEPRPSHAATGELSRPQVSRSASAPRRSLLKSASASVAALVGTGLFAAHDNMAGVTARADADTGATLIIGQTNTGSATTSLQPVAASSPEVLFSADNSTSASTSASAAGLAGSGPPGAIGVAGVSLGSDMSYGVFGVSDEGYGVVGSANSGIDLAAGGNGRFWQNPQTFTGSPTSGSYALGEQLRDSSGDLYICVQSGSPGTWKRVATADTNATGGMMHFLSTPIRLLDTRPGGVAAFVLGRPFTRDTNYTLQVAGTSVGGVSVPNGAVAVVGNVIVTNTTGAGWLTLYPADLSQAPFVSSLNYYTINQTIANMAITRLSGGGQMNIRTSSADTDAIFDVIGYVL